MLLAVGLASLLPQSASAGVTITRLTNAPFGAQVRASNPSFDSGGNTSIRHYPRLERDLKHDTVLNKHYYNRDRDLGQTFRVGAAGYWLDAVTIRTGFGTLPFRPGAAGAEMYLQIMRVEGTPVLNTHGTTSNPPGARWQTFNPADPTTDDYLTGETFTNVRVIRGATMPDLMPFKWNSSGAPGNGQFVRFALTGEDVIWLEPNTTYAFFIGFVAPAPERAMTFANQFRGNYPGGHGIRREGSSELPAVYNPAEVNALTAKIFVANTNDVADNTAALDIATFDDDFNQRVLDMDFGTMGMPDVCTYRDLTFYIEGRLQNPPEPPATDGATDSPNPPSAGVFFQGTTDGGTTSVRWREAGDDTDLGAVFRVGAQPVVLEGLTIRIAPANFGANVPGLPVVLDFYGVDDSSGWPMFTPLWRTASVLPATTAPDDYVTFHVGSRAQLLEAGRAYGFVIGSNVEDRSPAGGTETNRFRLYTSASDQRPDTYELRREYEFFASRPGLGDAPNDPRFSRDLLFYLTGEPHPRMFNPRREGNRFSVSVRTVTNYNYALEYKNSLGGAGWTPLPAVSGDGQVRTLSDFDATAPERFYHVRAEAATQ